jgi:hypothetical protein
MYATTESGGIAKTGGDIDTFEIQGDNSVIDIMR